MEAASDNRLHFIRKILPAVMLLTAIGGFCLTLALKRSDLSLFSLILVIPLTAAALLIIAGKNTDVRELAGFVAKPGFRLLLVFNALIFASSIIILAVTAERPMAYFILVAIYSGLLFLQIISVRPEWTNSLIIAQIIFLSLNLAWGLTLKYPLYFGDTDLLVHFHLIDTIVKTGHVAAYNVDYLHYPLYHIFIAMGHEITGGSLSFLLFVIMGLIWQTGVIFSFLIFRRLSGNSRLALIACLLFTLGSQTIFYGSYSIARSLAFVFFIGWVYFILKAGTSGRFLFLSLIALVAMVITHHLNVLYAILALSLQYVCQIAVRKFSRERPLELLFVYLLTISSIAYMIWIAPGMTDSTIPDAIRSIMSFSGIKSGASLTRGFGISVVFGMLYYSFAFFLALLGVKSFFDNLSVKGRFPGAFLLTGIIALVLYVPGFMYLFPFSDVLLTDRVILIVSPFVTLLMAYGIDYLCRSKIGSPSGGTSSYRVMLPVVLLASTTFFSTVSIGNAKDTNYFPHTRTVDSPYFADSEINAFSFLASYGSKSDPIYSDYAASRNIYMLSDFAGGRNIITAGNITGIPEAYVLLRTGELLKKQSLGFFPPLRRELDLVRYPIQQLQPEIAELNNSPNASRVFSNRNAKIYLTRTAVLP